MPTILDIRRHGKSDHNVEPSKFGLVEDSHLTQEGVEQAEKMAASLSDSAITRIIASSLIRAIETATIVAMSKELEVEVADELIERGYGNLDGLSKKEIEERLGEIYQAYKRLSAEDQLEAKLVPDMESATEALQRVVGYIKKIAKKYPNEHILLVTHSTIMRVLLIYLGYVKPHEIDSSCIKNTARILVEVDDDGKMKIITTEEITKKPGENA